jgi:hypothetical protein
MAEKVLPSIEAGGDPSFANSGEFSDGTYEEEERTPELHDPKARLEEREAAQNARREEEEYERAEDERVEAIRKLQETDPWEYEHRMKEYNLQLQGLTKAQIDKSNQPLPEEVIKSNCEGFSALFKGKVLQPATTDGRADARSESMEVSQSRASIRLQKPTKMVPRRKSTARDGTVSSGNRSKRPAPTLAGALADEESASNATNVKVPQSKYDKTRQRSRRIARKPVECGIFANSSAAPPIPKCLQRNPSTRRAVEPRNHASSKKSISIKAAKPQVVSTARREGTRRPRYETPSRG